MATFRGQARSQGFDPVKLPDTARRMLEASARKRAAQERVFAQDISQRQEYGRAMEQKAQAQIQDQRRHFREISEYEKVYRDQLKENYEALKQKEKAKTAQELNKLTQLGQFSDSILDLAKDLKDAQKDQDEEFGQALIAKYRVTKEEYNELRLKEADLQAEGAANNRVVELLKSRGATPDEINEIRKLDGWRLYGAQKQWAQSGGKGFAAYLQKNRNTKLDIDGQQISLNDAAKMDGATYAAVRDQLVANYSKPYRNLDPTFASTYFYPEIDKVVEYDKSQYISAKNTEFEEEEKNARYTALANIAAIEDPSDLRTYIDSQGLDHAGNRDQFLDDLYEMAKSGGQLAEEAKKLLNLYLTSPSGQNPKKTNGDLWLGSTKNIGTRTRINNIQDALVADDRKEFEIKIKNQQIEHEAIQTKVRQGLANGTISRESLSEVDAEMRKNPKTGYRGLDSSILQLTDQRRRMRDRELQDYVYTSMENGVAITADQIDELGFDASPQVRIELKKAVKDNSLLDFKAQRKVLVAGLKTVLQTTDSQLVGGEVDLMADIGMRQFVSDYNRLLKQFNPQEALDRAKQLQNKLIQDAKTKNEGIFALRTNPNGTVSVGFGGGFVATQTTQADSADRLQLNALEQAHEEDPEYLRENKAFGKLDDPKSWINKLNSDEFRKYRKMPWYIKVLAKDANTTPEQLINDQLEEYGLNPIDFTTNRFYVPPKAIRPELRRLLNGNTSSGAKVKALQMTHNIENPGNGYKPVLDLISSVESSNDTVHGGYDALNTGGYGRNPVGTNTGLKRFGRPLVDFTVGEIIDMQNNRQLMAAGRYQFIPSTLIEQVRDQNIDLNAKFDQSTQDQLAIGYLNSSIGYFRSSGRDVIYGLGQRWHGLQSLSRSEIQKVIDRLSTDKKISSAFEGLDYRPGILKSYYNT